jgi:beta-fructofuranosidase
MNDPNGTVFHNGFYHLFYQANPKAEEWGDIHWAHARSRDLILWEHLPIALSPDTTQGEVHCYSGCFAHARAGTRSQPALLYTSVAGPGTDVFGADQRLAYGDADLLNWNRPSQPVFLPITIHGSTRVEDWRDPFLFTHDNIEYCLVGGTQVDGSKRTPAVFIYQAKDDTLFNWIFLGTFWEFADATLRSVECPNVFFHRGKCVMLHSSHGRVHYVVGRFDARAGKLVQEHSALLDHSEDFYATNFATAPDGRTICFGWVRNFPTGLGWRGCIGVPRELDLDDNLLLRQRPAREYLKSIADTTVTTFESDQLPTRLILLDGDQPRFDFTAQITGATRQVQVIVDVMLVEIFIDDRHAFTKSLDRPVEHPTWHT